MREYSCDLVEHLARLNSDSAVPSDPAIRRYLGVGKRVRSRLDFLHSTPPPPDQFLAFGVKARGLTWKPETRIDRRVALAKTAITFRRQDRMVYEAFASSEEIAADLEKVAEALAELAETRLCHGRQCTYPLDAIANDFELTLTPESFETFLSLLLELVPDEADALRAAIDAPDEFSISPAETLDSLAALIRAEYGWALDIDMSGHGRLKQRAQTDDHRRIAMPSFRSSGVSIASGSECGRCGRDLRFLERNR